jgi:thiol:disulfide interchange protein
MKDAGFFIVFFMGGVSALLAGACVAPVVIAALIFCKPGLFPASF